MSVLFTVRCPLAKSPLSTQDWHKLSRFNWHQQQRRRTANRERAAPTHLLPGNPLAVVKAVRYFCHGYFTLKPIALTSTALSAISFWTCMSNSDTKVSAKGCPTPRPMAMCFDRPARDSATAPALARQLKKGAELPSRSNERVYFLIRRRVAAPPASMAIPNSASDAGSGTAEKL